LEGPATLKYKEELKAFLVSLGLQGPALDKVTELNMSDIKKQMERSNLDDLNDVAKSCLAAHASAL
jgi:hypothetical protein